MLEYITIKRLGIVKQDVVLPVIAPKSGFGYFTRSIQGLGPVATNIVTSNIAQSDGVTVDNALVPARNIVMVVEYHRDYTDTNSTIENLRRTLHNLAGPKDSIELIFSFTNGSEYRIQGVIESHESNMFSAMSFAQISILCPDPYFKGDPVLMDGVTGTSMTSTNLGDVATPFVLQTEQLSTGYFGSMRLQRYKSGLMTGEFKLTGPTTTPSLGKSIFMKTDPMGKVVAGFKDPEMIKLYRYIELSSEWFSLESGNFEILLRTYKADTNRTELTAVGYNISFNPLFRGL